MGAGVPGGRSGGETSCGAAVRLCGGVVARREAGALVGGAFSGAAAEGPPGAGAGRGCGAMGAATGGDVRIGCGRGGGAFVKA